MSYFKDKLVTKVRMSFKDTVSYNRLFNDLMVNEEDPDYGGTVNLKELRD